MQQRVVGGKVRSDTLGDETMTRDGSSPAAQGAGMGIRDAFLKATVQPSALALAVALLVNVMLFAGFTLFVTPDLVAGPARRFLMEDQYDRNLALIEKMREMRSASPPRVVVFGGSLVVRCIASEEELAAQIALHEGDPAYEVRDLSVDGQTAWDMAALAEILGPTMNGIVVIGLGPEVLGHDDEDFAEVARNPRLAFRTDVLDSLTRAAGHPVSLRTGNYFLDNWRFLAARGRFLVHNVRNPPDPEPGEQFDKWWMESVNNPGYWATEIRRVGGLAREYDANKTKNFAMIDWAIEALTADGRASVIILEAPYNPRWELEPAGKAFYDRYRAELRQFAATRGLSHISATDRAQLVGTDFVDYEGHIGVADARERCTRAVAEGVQRVIQGTSKTSAPDS